MSEGHELRQRDVRASAGQTANEKAANGGVNGVRTEKRHVTDDEAGDRCLQLEEKCTRCCIPCLTSHNPLPENASFVEKVADAFRFPPHGSIASYLQFFVVCLQIWIVLYTLTHQEALPGGNFYSLLILFVFCVIGGYFISFVNLPPLLGMLIVGLLLRNIPGIKFVGEHINVKWSGALRKIALTVILTRAGLGLDIVKLKKLSWAVLRLAFLPSAAEIITASVVSKFLLGFPWLWSMMLGCIMGALSPAVTVPSLVNLQDRRYGVDKGIPTMLLAAGGLDNVLCVTGFSVFMGIIFSDGDLVVTIFKGPIGVCVGIAYGFIVGVFLWYIPAKDCGNRTFFRSMMLICAGLVAIFGSSEIGLSGAGPLGCLTTATVAAYRWRKERQPGETDEVAGVMALSWLIVQHFLFGLIGTAVDVNHIQSNTAGYGIATLAVGLIVRSLVSFNVTIGTGFNIKERVFVTLTWLSKATVQAAIGGLALDKVLESENPNEDEVKYATDVLTISVLAIIICAPIGATLMAVLGPRFLVKGDDEDVTVEVKNDEITTDVSKDEHNVEKFEVTNETELVVEDVKPVENHKFKSELSLTLQNLAAKLEEKEPVLNNMKTTNQTIGIDNPAFAEAEVDLSDDEEGDKDIPKETVNTDIDETSNLNDIHTEDTTVFTKADNMAFVINEFERSKPDGAQLNEDEQNGTNVDDIGNDTDDETKAGKYVTIVQVPANDLTASQPDE